MPRGRLLETFGWNGRRSWKTKFFCLWTVTTNTNVPQDCLKMKLITVQFSDLTFVVMVALTESSYKNEDISCWLRRFDDLNNLPLQGLWILGANSECKGHLKEAILTNQYEIWNIFKLTHYVFHYNLLTYFVVLYRFVLINNSTAQIIGSRDLV